MGHMTTQKTRKVYDHGGSTVISLPRDVQELLDVSLGDHVLLQVEDGQVTINKASISAVETDGGDGA